MVLYGLKQWQLRAPVLAFAAIVGVIVLAVRPSAEGDKCWKAVYGKTNEEPTHHSPDRCLARHKSLTEAQEACVADSECTGIGHDDGWKCGEDTLYYELRKSPKLTQCFVCLIWGQETCGAEASINFPGSDSDVKALVKNGFVGFGEQDGGIQYKTVEEGSGDAPAAGAKVTVGVNGFLMNGVNVVSSYNKNKNGFQAKPLQWELGKAPADKSPKGFNLIVAQMKKGEKRVVLVPPEQAYGDKGNGGLIKWKAWLVYYLELQDIA
jgi:hypothetical protein